MCDLIAAIQIQQMLQDRDGLAARPMTDVFRPDDQPVIEAIATTLEGRTTGQRDRHPLGSLAHTIWICARLGEWTGYYGKPGPIVLDKTLQTCANHVGHGGGTTRRRIFILS